MPKTDRKHERKLREAEKAYNKWKRAFIAGKISKDELKEKLRPYKYELHELNLVKLKEGDLPPKEGEEGEEEKETPAIKVPVTYPPWKKRSSLTMEEIEEKIDLLSLGSKPSETLQMLYEKRYGEELSPPEDPILFDLDDEPYDQEDLPASTSYELPPADDDEEEEAGAEVDGAPKKRFWKGLLKRKSEA